MKITSEIKYSHYLWEDEYGESIKIENNEKYHNWKEWYMFIEYSINIKYINTEWKSIEEIKKNNLLISKEIKKIEEWKINSRYLDWWKKSDAVKKNRDIFNKVVHLSTKIIEPSEYNILTRKNLEGQTEKEILQPFFGKNFNMDSIIILND